MGKMNWRGNLFSAVVRTLASLAEAAAKSLQPDVQQALVRPGPPVDTTQIHRWAMRARDDLIAKHGTELSRLKVVDLKKVHMDSIERYNAFGKFVCKPEHTEQQLSQRLRAHGVAPEVITAWTNGAHNLKEGFEAKDEHILTADNKRVSGEYRGALQVTTSADGDHEVYYVLSGTKLKIEQKLKGWLEVKIPILGKRARVIGQESTLFNTTDKVVWEDVVVDYKIEWKPEYYPEGLEPEVYEMMMDVLLRDTVREFTKQYPIPLEAQASPGTEAQTPPRKVETNMFGNNININDLPFVVAAGAVALALSFQVHAKSPGGRPTTSEQHIE